ncbi:MAG: aminomethyl-transferring glycine dehydrogenase subunit GcvPA [Spirochaetes bacterium]|nr:aminomethyl-transferring glycine dehydrogenase subunit GcvPA [Spirochaetota bacterium]
MIKYIPDSEQNIKKMLDEIGVKSVDDLFADIPQKIRLNGEIGIGKGISEYEAYKKLLSLSEKNNTKYINFLGCGCYDHIIPSVVKHITSRSEFYTAYTPYQAEISQGVLQAIFEYQTIICELTGMDVSNASLYDGATAAYEAAVIGLQTNKKGEEILFSSTLHPYTKEVLHTSFSDLPVKLIQINEKDGETDFEDLKKKLSEKTAAVICQSPNIYGIIENYEDFAEEIHRYKAIFVISSNPLSLSYFKSQREWGADVAIGDLQPAGIPMYFGGPSAGYIATTMEHVRKLPGRIAGQTVDKEGKRGFVLTLQAREQHIKRERATSNICSNQALMALASLVYFCSIGRDGFREVGKQNYSKSHYLADKLTSECGLKLYGEGKPFFNEFTIEFGDYEKAKEVLKKLEENNIFGGVLLDDLFTQTPFLKRNFSENNNMNSKKTGKVAIAVTEKRTKEEIDLYINEIKKILRR